MLAILTVALSLASQTAPVTMRQYQNHIQTALDSAQAEPAVLQKWIDNNVTFAVMTQDTTSVGADTANMKAQITRAQTMGIPAHPGMRTHPPNIASALARSYWDGVAAVLTSILNSATDGVVMLDVEDYTSLVVDDATLAAASSTVLELRLAMAPVLAMLKGWHCELYPLNSLDHVHEEMVDACDSVDAFTERSFGLGDQRRTNLVAYEQHFASLYRHSLNERYPGGVVVLGLYDDFLKPWGQPMRNAVAAGEIGDNGRVWLFDFYRDDRTYNAGWWDGTGYDTRNDVNHAWSTSSGSIGPEAFIGAIWCASVVNTGQNVHGALCNENSKTAMSNGSYFWPNQNGTGDDWLDQNAHAVAVELTIPSGAGRFGVLGHYQTISLYVDGADLVARYVDEAGGNYVTVGQVTRDVESTFVLTFDLVAESMGVAIASQAAATQVFTASTTGPVVMSHPTHIYSARAFSNDLGGEWHYCEGCTVGEQAMMIWDRNLTPVELAAITQGETWPYGRQ